MAYGAPLRMRIAVLTFESPQADAIIERLLAMRQGEVCGVVRSEVLVEGRLGGRP